MSGPPPGLPFDFAVKVISAGDPDIADEIGVAAEMVPPDALGTVQRIPERLLRLSPFGRAIGPIPEGKICLVARFEHRGNNVNFFLIKEHDWWTTLVPISAVLSSFDDLSGLPDEAMFVEPPIRAGSNEVRDIALELASAWEIGRCPRVKTIRFLERCLDCAECRRDEVADALGILRGILPGRRPCRSRVGQIVVALRHIANYDQL